MPGIASRRRPDPIRLEAFIRETGVSYKLNAKSYILTCPKCRKPDRLWLYRDGSAFICFVCAESEGFKGAPEYALKELTGRSIQDVREAIYGAEIPKGYERLQVSFDASEDDEADFSIDDAPDLAWPLHYYSFDDVSAAPGVAYLEGRGVPSDIAQQYDIRYSTYDKAVAFPVWVGDRLVGWQNRIIGPEVEIKNGKTIRRLKVVSTPDIPRPRVVMFQSRLQRGGPAVVCEGPVDALKAHLVGGNVATMGKAVSDGQVEVLRRAGVGSIYLALDPDAASEIEPLLKKLNGLPVYKVEVPNPYKDLGEMTMQDAREVILSSKPLMPGRVHVFFKT